jgi:Uma2 family endonuclease
MATPGEIERLTVPHIVTPKAPHGLPLVPPLEPGDQLTRDEFERRYDAMPHLKKAELLEGEVHMPSPVRWKRHANPHADMIGCLFVYRASTPGVEVGDNGSVRLDMDSEPQPDAAMIIEPSRGGRVQISSDDYVVGGPELVAEVAASSVSIDLTTKLRIYRRNQVQEYLVWRVLEQSLDWFVLRNSQYERLSVNADGFYQSEVFPGLWLDAAALTRFDPAAVLRGLQKGLASPEHAAFVAKLDQTVAQTL